MSLKITFFDLETTDQQPMGNQILTSYFKTVELPSFKVIDSSYLEFKPDAYRVESFKVHGISEERAKTFPNRWESFKKLINYMLKNKDSLFCCHANGFMFGESGYFDKQVISAVCFERGFKWYIGFERAGFEFISTHSIAKKLLDKSQLELNRKINPVTGKLFSAYSQENIARHYGIKYNAHDAIQDVETMEQIFKNMVHSEISRAELIDLSTYQIKEKAKQYDENGLPLFSYKNAY